LNYNAIVPAGAHGEAREMEIKAGNYARTFFVVLIVAAFAVLTLAIARGGDILMIVLGLSLAATAIQLYEQLNPKQEDEE
jgi:hypothetical protein